jgi:ribulose-phosphate 3-epimerase
MFGNAVVLRVAPSILSANFAKLGAEIEAIDKAGCDWIHIDVMDGRFVPNLTFGLVVMESIRPVTKKPFDVHLMILEPERYVERFRAAGADHINVHVEATTHLHRTLSQIRESGAKAGAVLNPATPLNAIEHVVSDLDQLMLMTVNPGFGGQRFIQSVVPKITAAKELLKRNGGGRPLEIVIDGGVDPTTARVIEKAGATVAVAGSAVFKSGDYRRTIEQIRGTQRTLKTTAGSG